MNRACSRCGSENRPDARFCFNCGSDLHADATAAPGGPPQPERADTQPLATGKTTEEIQAAGGPVPGLAPVAPPLFPGPGVPAVAPKPTVLGNPVALVALTVAALALVAAILLWFSRAGLADERAGLQSRLEERSDQLAARGDEVTDLEEERTELEARFDVCRRASQVGQEFLDAWRQVFSAGSRAEANQLFAQLADLSSDWQQAMTECMAQ